MGLVDRLLGRERGTQTQHPYGRPGQQAPGRVPGTDHDPDAAAVERYRYLLRTAPPEAIEQAHAEAFARLTAQQRRQVLQELGSQVPPAERAASDDPRALARMATRAELSRPGVLERSLGSRGGAGIGTGGLLAGSVFASVAGAFVGTAIASELLDGDGFLDCGDFGGGDLTGF